MEKREEYYRQLEDGIQEMEAVIDSLRNEIHDLRDQRDTLLKLNAMLKKELKEKLF